jgi:hypothetical protein
LINNENFYKLIFILLLFFLIEPWFLSAGRIENVDIDSSIGELSSDGGLVNFYDNLRQMASVAPEVFDADGNFYPFKVSKKSNQLKTFAELPDGGRIELKFSMKLIQNGAHIHYVLIPKKIIKVPLVFGSVCFPYADWEGDAYHLGTESGVIPSRPSKDFVIGKALNASVNLGPSHVNEGIEIKIISNGWVGIRNSRNYNGNLYVAYACNDLKHIWKLDEAKNLDIDIIFNRKVFALSNFLNKLEPEPSSIKLKKINDDQLDWGQVQLERMLNDRPAMKPYIRKGDDLWVWVVRKFAGEYVNDGIFWDARNPNPLWDAMSYSGNGKKAGIRVSENIYKSEDGHWGKPKTGATLWIQAVFEILNLEHTKQFNALDNLVLQNKINKPVYVLESMLIENQTKVTAKDFLNKIWIPHCRKLSLPYEDSSSFEKIGGRFDYLSSDEVFKNEFNPDSEYFKLFAFHYDKLRAEVKGEK